jgi:hypothetical protein
MEASVQNMEEDIDSIDIDDSENSNQLPVKAPSNELWVDKYTSHKFFDLLTDE